MKLNVVSQSLCFQGVLLRPAARRSHWAGLRLNPFVFRAYYCETASVRPSVVRMVSIPLFSGRITAKAAPSGRGFSDGLNPFVFRAYYCAS